MSCVDFFLVSYFLLEYVNKAEIGPGYLSDHSSITIGLVPFLQVRGKSYWKFNSLLVDKDYVKLVKETILNTAEMNPNFENMLLWEVIKNQIRGNTIQYSSIKKKAKNDKIIKNRKYLVSIRNTI